MIRIPILCRMLQNCAKTMCKFPFLSRCDCKKNKTKNEPIEYLADIFVMLLYVADGKMAA